MELHERIVSKTFELMSRFGTAAVTMDMIASNCGISKRTLYEHFSDKRTLVRHVILDLYYTNAINSIHAIKKAPNKLEALLSIYFLTREIVTTVSEAFMNDISRLYPEIEHDCQKRNKLYTKQLSELIRQGQEEGVFRPSSNSHIYATIFTLLMRDIKSHMSIFPTGTSLIQILDAAFINFIRGIASKKGMDIIDKALSEHNIEQ